MPKAAAPKPAQPLLGESESSGGASARAESTPDGSAESASMDALTRNVRDALLALPVARPDPPMESPPASIIPAPVNPFHAGWFAPSVHPPRPDMVPALAVLLVTCALADDAGTCRVGDLFGIVNASVVQASLPLLRAQGWVQYDGVTIRVLCTPPVRP